jgi:hypothetical protein
VKKLLALVILVALPTAALAQSSPAKFPGLQMAANNTMPTCVTGSGCLRYNSATGAIEISLTTGAYSGVTTLTDTQVLTNKTLTAPVLGGTVTGTYTLGGTPTILSPLITGTATITLAKPTRITNNSAAPAVSTPAANVQFGVAPSMAIAGGDVGGNMTLTTGTGPTVFGTNTPVALTTITWNTTFSSAPRSVPLHPCNNAAGSLIGNVDTYVDIATCTTTQCTVKMVGSTVALTPTLAASTAYQFCYVVIQ